MIRTDIVIATVIGALLIVGPAHGQLNPQQVNVEQIVAQKVQPILPENGGGGGGWLHRLVRCARELASSILYRVPFSG
jgi:hypothetical protein